MRVEKPLLVYCIAAVITTWPLALHPATYLGAPVGPGDPYLNLWILGWGMQAFVSDPGSLLTGRVFDANIFHPAAGTLAYSDHLLLQSGVLAPLYAVTRNVVLCYNVLLLASLVASALAMHAFVRSVAATTGGAYLAGLAWGFGSYRFAHLLHLQLQSLYFLPLTFLFLHRLIAGRRRRDGAALGALYGLQALSSVYYAVIGGLALACGALALVLTARPRRLGVLASRLLLAVLVGAVVIVPVGIVYWRVQQGEGFGRNLYQAVRGAAYVDSYMQAPPGNVIYGRTGLLRPGAGASSDDPPRTGPERELFPGVMIIILAVVGAVAGLRGDNRPLVAAMAWVGVFGFVLSLGPDGVRPLYATLHRYLFGFQAIRAPARFSIVVMFALSVLGALGWQALSLRSMRRGPSRSARRAVKARPAGRVLLFGPAYHVARVVPILVFVLATLEWLHIPVTLAGAPALRTEVGEWLRRAPGDGAVAVLPLQLDVDSTPAMVQSLEHRRPLVNGYSGQRPAFYPALVDAMSTFPSDEALLALRESDVQYVVTRELEAPPAPLVPRARFSESTIYELQWTPEIDARLARASVVPPPPGPIPFRSGEKARYAVFWAGAGMNVVAGEIAVEVQRGSPPYRFVVTAETAAWVARFFEARDFFATTTDQALMTRVHEREQHEGARHVARAFVYDRTAGVVRIGRSVDDARLGDALSLPMAPEARDAIATLFYARTLPLQGGALYQVPVNEAGRNLVVEIVVTGREAIQVQGRSVDAIRLEPRIQRRVERRRSIAATIWLSADTRRVPLALDVDAGFGRVRAELSSYEAGP